MKMLGNKNKNKKTVLGGIGTAIFLCALMAFMPMSSLVDNPVTENVTEIETEPEFGEYFKLPDTLEKANTQYDESQELLGMRDPTTKGYLLEDGRVAQLTSPDPIHFLDETGVYQEIDLNIKASPFGWEVSENTFKTNFASELHNGVSIQADVNVDPIITGINPMVVSLDSTGTNILPVDLEASMNDVEVGGNVIRYPVADGYALDYAVHATHMKQNLLIDERPVFDNALEYFGFTEMMLLPEGFGLYLDGELLGDEPVSTQNGLEIRETETGKILAFIPSPTVLEEGSNEPYIGTYFIQVDQGMVLLTTAVETDWLASEDRVFPIMIDPSVVLLASSAGECNFSSYYGGYCRTSAYNYGNRVYMQYSTYRGAVRVYDLPFYKFTFSASNQLPTGATIDEVNFVQTVTFDGYSWRPNPKIDRSVAILEACGTPTNNQLKQYTVPTASCSGSFAASSIGVSSFNNYYSTTFERQLISSIWNSDESGTYGQGTGKKTAELCDNSNSAGTLCTATGNHNYIINAVNNTGTVGIGLRMNTTTSMYAYSTESGNNKAYLEVIYSGGSDTKAPTADFVPYTGITSYVEGERTFFTTIFDQSGVDTTAGNMPTLVYRINNQTWTSVNADTIKTCSSSASECKFKATTPDITAGDYVEYYWKFQDLAATANVGYHPVPPTTNTAPESWARTNAHWFFVDDVDNAGTAKKFQIYQSDLEQAYSYSSTGRYDKQMTYFDHSDEYLVEFDTTGCGSTQSTACFIGTSGSPYSWVSIGYWEVEWTTRPSTGYYGTGGTRSGELQMAEEDGGYLVLSNQHGPQMNLMFLYDATLNEFAMVGIGDSTPEIETGTLVAGTDAVQYRSGYSYYIPLANEDINGTFAKFDWGYGSYSSSKANHICVLTSGWIYWYAKSYSPRCYTTSSSSAFTGIGTPMGSYQSQDSSGVTQYKTSNVKPTPDTFAPEMTHGTLMDSHSKTRTFTYTILDNGDPATGLNINRTIGEGPTLYYTINNGTQQSVLLNPPSGTNIADCELSACDWSYTLTGLNRSDYVSYYATSVDKSTVSSGTNQETTTAANFEVGDPNQMFIVEWRDIGYSSGTTCSYQVIFYDVTNEIEFNYDTACKLRYDYGTTGFMDHTRTNGQHIKKGESYLGYNGGNPFTTNYRITTDGTNSSVEEFALGMDETDNAVAVISGTTSGFRMSNCASTSSWSGWSRYTTQCNANVDVPAGFTFDYFEKSFDGDDSQDRLRIGLNGYLYFIDSGSQALEQGIYFWGNQMIELPYNSGSGNTYARPGTIAPFWGYGSSSWTSLYCYDNTAEDCGVYVRTVPFEGKGTDIKADLDCSSLTAQCTWDSEGSPYRIDPSGDFLSVSGGDLTIEPGTVVQVATGKGISFDGQCDSFNAEGDENNRILFEGQSGGEWKGISFTDDCSGGTDDRHVLSFVDFKNTSTAAISAGSRHSDYSQVCTDSNGGQRQCSSDKNVGNFTLTDVTFTNVETAIRHGSGAGTGISMTDFTISDADKACINLPKSSNAMLKEGTMSNCNKDGETWGGAIVTFPGSTGGMLHVENVTITDAYYNLISTDVQHVTISNVSASITSGTTQAGTVFKSDFGVDSEVNLFNFDADDYTSASINALKVINMTEVNWGTDTDLTIVPGGAGSNANGPFGSNAIIDDVTVGDIMMYRMQPEIINDLTAGHIDISGDAIVTDAVTITNLDSGRFGVAGCGWTIVATTVDADRVYSQCTTSSSKNTMTLADGTLTHTSSTDHAVYGRNSKITLGQMAVTSSNAGSGVFLAYASQNTDILLINVSQNGNDCADASGSTGDCDTSNTGSATIYYGGLAELRVYRLELVNSVIQEANKSGHTVTTSLVDGSNSELFEVGSHITDADGKADVWVITEDSSGTSYSDHNLRAFGPAGQNETLSTDTWYISDLSSGFTIGTSYALELKPAPKEFNGTNMDCAWLEAYTDSDGLPLPTNGQTAAGETIFEFDGTPITVSEDLTLDGCEIRLLGAEIKVKSTATNSPVITISNGGKLLVGKNPTSPGALGAISPSYPLSLDIQDGTLEVDGGVVRDIAQDATTGAALFIGADATLILSDSGTIYGSSTLSDDMATVKVDRGTISVDTGSIINTGQTGTALWIEGSGNTLNNIAVSNAAVGIKSMNAAPQINGFTSTGSDVGVDVEGGLSLPIIYRSTSLSGESRGWKTYEIDMTNFLGSDYLQVGANSIYGGGNAHPRTQYYTNYYMMSDRWNIEITYDDGTGEVSENVSSSDKLGYYPYGNDDPASGQNGVASYSGGEGGVASWHCNYYGTSYGPAYTGGYDGSFSNIYQYWPEGPQSYPGYISSRYYPSEFGFRWTEIDETYTPSGYSTQPYHYWSMYSTASWWYGFSGVYEPPEGLNGYRGYYNVCADSASNSWWSPTPTGVGARMTFPIVDISSPTITGVTMYVDVLHNRADNYQDRFEIVARSGNDPSDLGTYNRESGVAKFEDGTISGADTGIVLGGSAAAANIDDVTINSPVFAGIEIDGSVGGSSVNDTEVNGGDYGIYFSSFARGEMDATNLDLDNQGKAGIYYLTDFQGDHSGSITNSAGAAYKYGPNTQEDLSFDGMTLSGNSIGIETAGSGDITVTDSTFANTDDNFKITGTSEVDFIGGSIDSTKVNVTGDGGFDRKRSLELTLDADSTVVEDATVLLMNADKQVTGSGVTDSTGVAQGLNYRTIRVDSTGLTTDNLAGYQISTIAEIEYSSTVADFRYAFESVTLSDNNGNTAAVTLTDNVDV
jgi:hypothetical protein